MTQTQTQAQTQAQAIAGSHEQTARALGERAAGAARPLSCAPTAQKDAALLHLAGLLSDPERQAQVQ